MSWFLATLHLLALAIGIPAVWARARALRRPLDAEGIRRILAADVWWGIAAGLWIVTGLLRAFGPWEKGAAWYLHNHFFFAKMGLLVAVLLLEILPMATLIGWRMRQRRGEAIDTRRAFAMARISDIQLLLALLMVVFATGMARGLGVLR
jgi:putative membrane protein